MDAPTNAIRALQTFLSQQETPFEVYVKLNNEITYMVTKKEIMHCLHVYLPATVDDIARDMQSILNASQVAALDLRIYAYHRQFPKIVPTFAAYVKTLFPERQDPPNFHVRFVHHPEYNCSFAM